MTYVTNEVISLFSFLLPGFITALIFYGVTSFPKRTEFEAIVVALVFTTVVRLLATLIESTLYREDGNHIFGSWSSNTQLLWSVGFAVLLGLLFAFLMNNDILHKALRKLHITNQTSYPSEWYGTFSENKNYIVLHLKDGRSLYGWPHEWPSIPSKGHFVITEPEWLIKDVDSSQYNRRELDQDLLVLLDATLVEMVEFVRFEEDPESDVKKTTAT